MSERSAAQLILAAAALLPGLQAHAESAPDRASLGIRYLDYAESQPGLDRIKVHAPSVDLSVPIAGEWLIESNLTSDHVSGASPRYHTAVSGASRMSDLRKAGDVRVTRYFGRATLSAGAAYSTEHDYRSRAVSADGSWSTEDKNTVVSAGVGFASDEINPVTGTVTGATRQTADMMAGLTRILGTDDVAQLTLTYAHGHGYFSDPYKSLDNRPPERNPVTLSLRWNHHLVQTDGTARTTYRYYSDNFGVRAHTLTLEYVQPLRDGWTVTPMVRLYSQRAASFYYDPVYDSNLGTPFPPGYRAGDYNSADQRLSAFGARTVGLKIAKQIGEDWLVDVKFERYAQHTGWRWGGDGSLGLAPLNARVWQVGLVRQW
ncbi:MAG: DUF3570 domain-containing protein [Telluria sp.]